MFNDIEFPVDRAEFQYCHTEFLSPQLGGSASEQEEDHKDNAPSLQGEEKAGEKSC